MMTDKSTIIKKEILSSNKTKERELLLVKIMTIGALFYQRAQIVFKNYDLTEPQYNILRILNGIYPKSESTKQIQMKMVHKHSNISKLTKSLLNKTLILKISTEDKRQVNYMISEKGIILLTEMKDDVNSFVNSCIHLDEKECLMMKINIEKMINDLMNHSLTS